VKKNDKWADLIRVDNKDTGQTADHQKKSYRYPGWAKRNTAKIYTSFYVRLGPNLVIGDYAVATFNPKKKIIRLRAATKGTPRSVSVELDGRTGRVCLVRLLNEIGVIRREIAGEYYAWAHDSSVYISLKRILLRRPKRDSPFLENSTRGIAFEMCKRGTLITELKKLARDRTVDFEHLLARMLDTKLHGYRVIRKGESIKLIPPEHSGAKSVRPARNIEKNKEKREQKMKKTRK
jgi:hypothetical protein